jgi:hypothetical protein
LTVKQGRFVPVAAFAAFLCMLGAEAYGFSTHALFAQQIWVPAGLKHLARYTGWFLAVAAPALLMAPWLFTPLICAAVVCLTAAAVGPMAVFGVAFFLLSGHALGRKLLGTPGACATLLGVSVYLLLMNLTARAPLNYWWTWGIVLAIPLAADWRGAWRSVVSLSDWVVSAKLRPGSLRLGVAALIFTLGAHWLVVLKPEKSADGLAMHLAIPANIAAHHAMTFQPARFVWAVMPMNADWAYSIVYLFGGEFAARLLNFAFLLIALALLESMLRPLVSPPVRALFLVLFATTPLVQLVTGSLFVENLLTALLLGTMAAIWQFAETGESRHFLAAMTLGGTALATKFGALGFLTIAVPFALYELWRRRGKRLGLAFAGAGLLAVCALPPYAVAWEKTGNPLFPFLNEKIHSPLIDPGAQFRDNEFRMPLTWRTPYELTFETRRYYESQDGAFGFQYLLLVPLALLAAGRRARSAAAAGLAAAILTLRAEPNARFVYYALPLVMVGAATAISRMPRLPRAALLTCLAACAALNFWFLPASGWYHKDFYVQSPFRRDAAARYIRQELPFRDAARRFDRTHPGAAVFQAGDIDLADVTGEVYENHWHQYNTLMALRRAEAPERVAQLFRSWDVRYVIAPKPSPGEPFDPPVLGRFVEACSVMEDSFRNVEVRVLEPERCAPAQ